MSTNMNNLKKKIASNNNNINVAAVTCGIIKLITMCFGLTFKWSIATGIWLVLSLLSIYFKPNNNK